MKKTIRTTRRTGTGELTNGIIVLAVPTRTQCMDTRPTVYKKYARIPRQLFYVFYFRKKTLYRWYLQYFCIRVPYVWVVLCTGRHGKKGNLKDEEKNVR